MRKIDTIGVAAGIATALALTSCGGSQPDAATLARKIPGCGQLITQTPPSIGQQDMSCTFQDGEGASVDVEIVTFANSANEQQWISDGGSPMSPDPAYGGCCVQGATGRQPSIRTRWARVMKISAPL